MKNLSVFNLKFIIINFFEVFFLLLSKIGFWKFKLSYNIFYYFYIKYKLLFEKKNILQISSLIKPNSIIIDVGANIGIYAEFFLRFSDSKSKILAYEPDINNFNILKEKFKGSKIVKCINKIVSNKNGYSYLKKNLSNPTAHFMSKDGKKIKTIKLDSILTKEKKKVSLIKIDVEGAEALVINGAKRIIYKYKPAIYMEYSAQRVKRYVKFDLINFLKKNRYKFYVKKSGKFKNISSKNLIISSKKNDVIDFLCK